MGVALAGADVVSGSSGGGGAPLGVANFLLVENNNNSSTLTTSAQVIGTWGTQASGGTPPSSITADTNSLTVVTAGIHIVMFNMGLGWSPTALAPINYALASLKVTGAGGLAAQLQYQPATCTFDQSAGGGGPFCTFVSPPLALAAGNTIAVEIYLSITPAMGVSPNIPAISGTLIDLLLT
jgi:hypothetical protein